MQQADAINPTSSNAQATALREPQQQQAPAEQRVAAAAAKRPAPVDEAQVSPQARQLAAQEETGESKQQRVDERLQPQRAQAELQQGKAASQQRFEVVA